MLTIEKKTQRTLCVLLGGSGHRRSPTSAVTNESALCRLVTGSTRRASTGARGEHSRLPWLQEPCLATPARGAPVDGGP
jgi:hypothetical protein